MTPNMRNVLCPTSKSTSSIFCLSKAFIACAALAVPVLVTSTSAVAQAVTPTVTDTVLFFTASAVGNVFGATLSPDGKTLWVGTGTVSTTPGTVSLLNVANLTVNPTSIPVGAVPNTLTFSDAGGRVFVANLFGSSLSSIDASHHTVVQAIDLSASAANPVGIISDSNRVFVSSLSGVVAELHETSPLTFLKNISVPGQSARMAVIPQNKDCSVSKKIAVPVYATDSSDLSYPKLSIIDPSSAKVITSISLKNNAAVPQDVVISPDAHYAYVSLFDQSGGNDGGVWVINLRTLKTETVVATQDSANYGEALSADGKYLLVAGYGSGEVALIDTKTNNLDYIFGVGNNPNSIVLTADGSKGFVTNETDGTVSVVVFSPSL